MAVSWTKELASALVQAGYRSLAKKYHPDVGGSHDDMLRLQATADHLSTLIETGAKFSGGNSGPKATKSSTWSRDDDTVSFDGVHCIRETEKAILCVFPDEEDEELWIPMSQIDEDSEVYEKGHKGKLVITRWLAKKKGLI